MIVEYPSILVKGEYCKPSIAEDLVENDIHYLSYYLKEKDYTTGSIHYTTITIYSSICLRIRKIGESVNTIDTTLSIITGSLGYCRVLCTIPEEGTYIGEVEGFNTGHATWNTPLYIIRKELG